MLSTIQTLRIGLVLRDDKLLPAWEVEMLRQLAAENSVSIYVITAPALDPGRKPLIYRMFRQFENWWFRAAPDAGKLVEATDILKTVAVLKAASPDLDLIYISSACANTAIDVHARFGHWRVVFGADGYRDARPPAFWEVMKRSPVTGSTLEVTPAKGLAPIVVYRGITQSVPFSVKNNFNAIAWRSASYLPLRVRELLRTGPQHFFQKYSATTMAPPALAMPGNITMAQLFAVNVSSYIYWKIRARFSTARFTWLYRHGPSMADALNIEEFVAMTLPPDTFWGDPFVVASQGHHYVFFESFHKRDHKGCISVIEFDNTGVPGQHRVVLDRPYHLSYPFVFSWNESYYMVPETCVNGTVELYEASKFPFEWTWRMNLMEGVFLVDATLVRYNDKWWLFACTRNHDFTSTNDQLVLYYRDDLFYGEWTPHAANPVVTDISNCRPAGKVFTQKGNLYRPAQNNASPQYGYGLVINEIEVLNETEYREKKIREYNPSNCPRFSAIHTFNRDGDFAVVDAIVK